MRRALPLAAAALVVAGCGGSAQSPSQSRLDGKTLFVQQCGACHTLADAGTRGSYGADLERKRPTQAAIFRAITQGVRTMQSQPMSRADAEKVAAYVARAVRTSP